MKKYKWMSYNKIESIEGEEDYIQHCKNCGIPVFDTFEEAKQNLIEIIENNIKSINRNLIREYDKLKITKSLKEP